MSDMALEAGYRREAGRFRLAGPVLGAAAVLVGFFGVLGGWAATAPLAGAAVAPGVLRVEDNRQTVQHPDGGVVAGILVGEGDLVEAGQVLLTLDTTGLDAALAVLQAQFDLALLTAARLVAERDGQTALIVPEALAARAGEAEVSQLLAAQRALLDARLAALRGERAIAEQRVVQLEQQQSAHRGYIESLRRQLVLIRHEAEGVRALHSRGHAPLTRVVALDRQVAALEGELAARHAALASAQEQVNLTRLDLEQRHALRREEIATALDAQGERIREVVPKLRAALDARRRAALRAPKAGRVVDLAVFTIGGVIGPGDRVLDIVPAHSEYLVEAELDPRDVTRVTAGSRAEIRLPALPRGLERLDGRVALVAPDRTLRAQQGDRAFYRLLVRIEAPAGARLASGMAATVTVPTEPRTLLEYLLVPLRDRLAGALRER